MFMRLYSGTLLTDNIELTINVGLPERGKSTSDDKQRYHPAAIPVLVSCAIYSIMFLRELDEINNV